MRWDQAILCGWPGLWLVWKHGRLSGLVLAAGFAGLLNGAVVASYVFPELVPATVRTLLWTLVGVSWGGAFWRTSRRVNAPLTDSGAEVDQGLFLQAQAEYLKGHWFEAEALLEKLLKNNPDDADARLLLVSVCRRSQRYDEAAKQLRRMSRCPGATKWELETERERALLESHRHARREGERSEGSAGSESRDDRSDGDWKARAA